MGYTLLMGSHGLWVRMSSKVSFSSHLWIYDFPRFNRNHWKSSKLYPYRQGSPHPAARHTHTHTHTWEFWVAGDSWKCIILSAHHQCLGETRDEGKGQQVAGENSMGLSFHVLSPYCVLAVGWEVDHRASGTLLAPRILKLIRKSCVSERGVFKALYHWNLRNRWEQHHVLIWRKNACQNIMLVFKNQSLFQNQLLAFLCKHNAEVS